MDDKVFLIAKKRVTALNEKLGVDLTELRRRDNNGRYDKDGNPIGTAANVAAAGTIGASALYARGRLSRYNSAGREALGTNPFAGGSTMGQRASSVGENIRRGAAGFGRDYRRIPGRKGAEDLAKRGMGTASAAAKGLGRKLRKMLGRAFLKFPT